MNWNINELQSKIHSGSTTTCFNFLYLFFYQSKVFVRVSHLLMTACSIIHFSHIAHCGQNCQKIWLKINKRKGGFHMYDTYLWMEKCNVNCKTFGNTFFSSLCHNYSDLRNKLCVTTVSEISKKLYDSCSVGETLKSCQKCVINFKIRIRWVPP